MDVFKKKASVRRGWSNRWRCGWIAGIMMIVMKMFGLLGAFAMVSMVRQLLIHAWTDRNTTGQHLLRVDQQQHPHTSNQVCLWKDLLTQKSRKCGIILCIWSEGAVVLGLMTAGSPSLMTVHQQRLHSGSCDSDLLHLSMSTMQTGRPASTDARTHARTRLRDDLQSCCCILHRIPPLTEALRHILTQFSQRNCHMLSKNLKPSNHS